MKKGLDPKLDYKLSVEESEELDFNPSKIKKVKRIRVIKKTKRNGREKDRDSSLF